MAEYVYLTVAEVEQMHRELIDEFGGLHGLRDRGALEAAVFRPQNGYYNSLAEEAAALMESLANNHPSWTATNALHFPPPIPSSPETVSISMSMPSKPIDS